MKRNVLLENMFDDVANNVVPSTMSHSATMSHSSQQENESKKLKIKRTLELNEDNWLYGIPVEDKKQFLYNKVVLNYRSDFSKKAIENDNKILEWLNKNCEDFFYPVKSSFCIEEIYFFNSNDMYKFILAMDMTLEE